MPTLFDSNENIIINAFKFPKPKHYVPNNFQAIPEKPIEQRIKILSEHLDSNIIDKDLQNYLDQAMIHSTEKGLNKLKKKSTSTTNVHTIKSKPNMIKTSVNCTITNNPGAFRLIELRIQGIKLLALIDTGASHSIINSDIVKRLGRISQLINISVSTCNGTAANNVQGKIRLACYANGSEDENICIRHTFLECLNTNGFSIIIGADLLFAHSTNSISADFWTINKFTQSKEKKLQFYTVLKIPLVPRTVEECDDLKIVIIHDAILPKQSECIIEVNVMNISVKTSDTIFIQNSNFDNRLEIIESISKLKTNSNTVSTFIKILKNSDIDISFTKMTISQQETLFQKNLKKFH